MEERHVQLVVLYSKKADIEIHRIRGALGSLKATQRRWHLNWLLQTGGQWERRNKKGTPPGGRNTVIFLIKDMYCKHSSYHNC